jgi:hypothetical protein
LQIIWSSKARYLVQGAYRREGIMRTLKGTQTNKVEMQQAVMTSSMLFHNG